MIFKLDPRTVWQAVAVSLATLPLVLSAQTNASGAEQNWRSANDGVGQYKRGHADILKWEQAHLPSPVPQAQAVGSLSLRTVDDVVRQAWQAHRDLLAPLAHLGSANVALIATGRWMDLDPGLQRRIEGVDEVLEVAAKAKKAWLQALAAQQVLKPYHDALEAAEAANELGRRMVSVGNWSRLQQTKVQLAKSAAHMNLARAQYAFAQAQAHLVKTLGLQGLHASVVLPASLPDLPVQAVPPSAWEQGAAAIQSQLPLAERMRHQANLSLAVVAYQTSDTLARGTRDEVLKVREFISEETVLHYNGMLSSVWDLLDESRNQSQAAIGAMGAQRDFWIADTDLQWVLQGGEPDSFVSLGGAGEAAAPAAH